MKSFEQKLSADQRALYDDAWWDKVTPVLVRWRYLIFLASLIIVFLVEAFEHLVVRLYGAALHVYFDVFFALFIPLSIWVLLILMEKTENRRAQAVRDFERVMKLTKRLGEATNWDDLITSIVRFPGSVIEHATAILYVLNPVTSRLEAEAICMPSGEVKLHPRIDLNPDSLPVGSLPQLLLQNTKGQSLNPPALDLRLPLQRYDLSIAHNDHQFAVLKLQFPDDFTPSVEELRMLRSAIPTIALALEGGMLQNLAADQAASNELQRQQIAQNLHDTLAQNIGYLRLKLDQLTGENAIREIGVVLQELSRMRDTADEAYQQVRNTLDQLNPIQQDDLVTVVTKQAEIISRRSGFRLRTNQVGTPFNLSPTTRQQILYIAREALHNIEKHACAQQATLQFVWLTSELIVKITDDGVGFDPRQIGNEGHYGLWIMQHRAQEIGGSLKVSRVEGGRGTEVTLWMPSSTPAYQNIVHHTQ
jgi:signal transduction histidine kinase